MTRIRNLSAAAMAALLSLTLLTGCNSSSTGGTSVYDYRLEGAFIQVMDHDDGHIVATLTRDGDILATGVLQFGNSPLAFLPSHFGIDSAYQAMAQSATTYAGGQSNFTVADASRFSDTVTLMVVDTFSIANISEPANHLLNGAGPVSLEWTAAANATAYVMAAVKTADAYTGAGYSQLAVSGVTAGTIPPDAFLDPISNEADTGLYNIYVYAVSGMPDSALAEKFLPAPLPNFSGDNISRNDFTGRFGTITVVGRDTVRVASS